MRIYLDIEATEFGELLQLGCVTEDNERYGVCVQPAFTKVTPRITALTGITQEDADEATPLFEGVIDLVNWAVQQDNGCGVEFFAFGKNDREFLHKTYHMHLDNGKSKEDAGMKALGWLINKTHNCAKVIYEAFGKAGMSLRSYFLTMDNQPLPHEHNALVDAVYLYKIMTAIDSGWRLPEGAEIVKFHKPALPPRTTETSVEVADHEQLQRKVICYYVNNKGVEKVQVFQNILACAKAMCQQAINAKAPAIKVAYRVLEAAINGDSYCNRKFFLVD